MKQDYPRQFIQTLATSSGKSYRYYSLPALAKSGIGQVESLPISIRIVLESLLRNCDEKKITREHVERLSCWEANSPREEEIPFVVSRVVLQDFTGIPLLCDLAAMRDVASDMGKDPKLVEPLVPVDMVVDHSIQVDFFGTPDALDKNMGLEFSRNRERYQFMKWAMQAFDTFKVVPPGVGIVHQVNLEHLFRGVCQREQPDGALLFPETLVGTDSHTTMINGVGVVGWGVGGIEAEAAMLGQPVYVLVPDVVGIELKGCLPEGVTATDLVLTITELLRREKVVGKFVEFFGKGAAHLSVTDRATLANMAPEYGATVGYFPVDEKTVDYLKTTGRSEEEVELFEAYFRAQGLFGMPEGTSIRYSKVISFDLGSVRPSLSGPRRPQDRMDLPSLKNTFESLLVKPAEENGFAKSPDEIAKRYPTKISGIDIGHADVLIAAITSCTNTSNPSVLIAAGLLAKKAVEKGLKVRTGIKTSFAPGSRAVPEYLIQAGLMASLEQLGFANVGYGCTTCNGNSGDLAPELKEAIAENDVVVCSVVSGNRNFEARIHPSIKANFLASPPLVVAFAIAGRMNIDLSTEPLGEDADGNPVYLRDIWPSSEEIHALMPFAQDPGTYRRIYEDFSQGNDLWNAISAPTGLRYDWPASTYIARPPFFENFGLSPKPASPIHNARALMILGDSVTTDHISPCGGFDKRVPAGQFLLDKGVREEDFNSYGSRRGEHEVMTRGTFANVRLKNMMIPVHENGGRTEGGFTWVDGRKTTIYAAAMQYRQQGVPTLIIAGEEYGTGSSRDWAAKGPKLLGVKAVIARSFERIHRSNLVGMGVLPLQFRPGDSAQSLGLTGAETFDIIGLGDDLKPRQDLILRAHREDGTQTDIPVLLRIDTQTEIEYHRHGGILPFVLRELLDENARHPDEDEGCGMIAAAMA